jgi:hypothetical protein
MQILIGLCRDKLEVEDDAVGGVEKHNNNHLWAGKVDNRKQRKIKLIV